MSRLHKAIALGVATGLLGLGISFVPFGMDLEEGAGLGLFFKLRGGIQAPPDVAVVSIDQESARHLNLPNDPWKWPRSLHARLVDRLAGRGASVIAFDLSFYESRSPADDSLLSEAMRKAGDVVLSEFLTREAIPLPGKGGALSGKVFIERVVPPIPILARSAVASVPFPLPKVPVNVSQYWTFKTGAEARPTLPVVAFHFFAMKEVGEEFNHLLDEETRKPGTQKEKEGGGASPDGMSQDEGEDLAGRGVENTVQRIRSLFENDPQVAGRMLDELRSERGPPPSGRAGRLIESLVKMYQGPPSPYLNFYGPAGSITTIPYHQVLRLEGTAPLGQKEFDFRGKAVFVGLSDFFKTDQKDDFHTVFSQPSGVNLSGVEIAATAFANLLEDKHIRPIGFGSHFAVILLWGVAVGLASFLLQTFPAAITVIGLTVLYGAASFIQFKTAGLWYPLVVPIGFQALPAFFAAVVWRSVDLGRERRNIRRAFEYYLPNKVVDHLSKSTVDFKANKELVYGICLYTDIEGYTSLSERVNPEHLGRHMDEYYEVLFKPIRDHGGVVSNIVADSTLALWVSEGPDRAIRMKACRAALAMAKAVDEFNRSAGDQKLPTRIGLHAGELLLGNVGAGDHYEYRPRGDIINAATRIGDLNKDLGTRILASEEVVGGLDGFLIRDLGKFLLKGKKNPLEVLELICPMEETSEAQRDFFASFSSVVDAFKRQCWDEAIERCRELVRCAGEDGPARYYLKVCEAFKQSPPGAAWDGILRVGGP